MDLVYKNDITVDEQVAGFQIKSVKNPENYFGSPERIDAVVLDINLSERIIKVPGIDSDSAYSHQKFGKYFNSGSVIEPQWLPQSGPESDFTRCIQKSMKYDPSDPIITISIPSANEY